MILHTFLAMLVDFKNGDYIKTTLEGRTRSNTKVCETLFRFVSFNVYKIQPREAVEKSFERVMNFVKNYLFFKRLFILFQTQMDIKRG